MKLPDQNGRLAGVREEKGGKLEICRLRADLPAKVRLFEPDGCLSGEGLRALVREELDEEQRMEASEHLDFCDRCVDRYAAALSGVELLAPPKPAAPEVMEAIRSRTRKLFFGRLMRVSVAAVMALVIWNGLLFGNGGLFKLSADWVNSRPEREHAVTQTVGGWGSGLNDLMNGLNSWMNSGVQGRSGSVRK